MKDKIKEKQHELTGNTFDNRETERLIEHILMIENKLMVANDMIRNHSISREEALTTMDKDSFVDWNMDLEKIGSKEVVVITQEMIQEWEQEWEDFNSEN